MPWPTQRCSGFGGGGGFAGGATLPARLAAAPAALGSAIGQQHLLAGILVRLLEIFPPLGNLGIDLAAVAAKHQEIIARTKARVGQHAVGPPAGPREQA